MDYILGLDVSTSVVGYAIVDLNLNLHSLSYINIEKEKSLINKAVLVSTELEKYKDIIKHVSIEEPLVMYKPGFSSAQILSKLSQFNGMCQLLSFSLYNTSPFLYNVNTARKIALDGTKFPKGCDRKKVVLDAVQSMYAYIEWPMGVRSGKIRKESYDMADALVIARTHAIKLKENDV